MRTLLDALRAAAATTIALVVIDRLVYGHPQPEPQPRPPAVSCRNCDPDRLWHGGSVAA